MDWSRNSRKHLSLLRFEPGQTKLTDYYTLLDDIENVMQKHPELHEVVTNKENHSCQMIVNQISLHYSSSFWLMHTKIPTKFQHLDGMTQ